jgi:hypothetical protein
MKLTKRFAPKNRRDGFQTVLILGEIYSLLTYLLTHSLTHSMEQSFYWETNRFVASQEIPCVLLNPKVH